MLETVDSIPWRDLTHALGVADDVPALLRSLASDADEERAQALAELYSTIWHQGTVYQASAYAIPFLVETAATQSLRGRADILGLIGAIADSKDGPQCVRSEIVKQVERLLEMLADSEPLVRAGAAHVLGFLPELGPDIARKLRNTIDQEQDPLVRAALLVSVGSLRDSTVENIEWLNRRFHTAPSRRERFAAAYAVAQSAGEGTPDAVISFLADAATEPDANSNLFEELPWDLASESLPRRALVSTGTAAYRVLTRLLTGLDGVDSVVASCIAEDALAVVFGLGRLTERPSLLNVYQRKVLSAISESAVLWTQPNLIAGVLIHYSLPTNRTELIDVLTQSQGRAR